MSASNGQDRGAPEAVLFDLDDTLYPERQFVDGGFRAVGSLLAAELSLDGAAVHDRLWELHASQGRGRLFDELLAEHEVADEDLVRACLVVYRTHAPELSAVPGVEGLLERLATRGAGLGLVSDGIASVQWRKLAALPGVADWLDVVIMTDELGHGHAKPAPTAFRVGCRLLDVEPGAAVYVANDPRKDFRGAREAGLRTVRFGLLPDEGAGMDRSFADADDADIAADSIEALARILGVDGPARPDQEVTVS